MIKRLAFTLLTFIAACSIEDKENSIITTQTAVVIDSLSFNTGMSINGLHSGFWEDKNNGKRLFYFGNLSTDKKIKVFSTAGGLVATIPLDSALKSNETIRDFDFIGLDTIVVLHEYTNKLTFINQHGIQWKEVDLNFLFQDSNGLSYEYYSTFLERFILDNESLILSRIAVFSEADMDMDVTGLDSTQAIRNWKSDQYIKIDQLFADTLKFTTGFKLYQHFIPSDSLFSVIELPYYQIANNSIFSMSKFSDSIYQLNTINLSLDKAHLIESSKTKIGVSAIRVGKYSISETRKKERAISRSGGKISGVFYNSERKHYYVTVSKTTALKFLEKEKYKPWLLQVYDVNFKKLQEIDFDDGRYYSTVIPSERGFLLEKRLAKPKKYKDQKVVYHEFTY